jgi:hypothetical protein
MPDQQKHTHAPQLSRTTIMPTAPPGPGPAPVTGTAAAFRTRGTQAT